MTLYEGNYLRRVLGYLKKSVLLIIKSSNVGVNYALGLSAFNSVKRYVTSVYLVVTVLCN